jgi:hypothetical protein
MDWTDEAKTKFKELLGEIPVFMRPLAEQMGRNEIAKVAAARGVSQVDLPTLIIGLIKATPPNLKGQMNEAMTKHGINLEEYREYL